MDAHASKTVIDIALRKRPGNYSYYQCIVREMSVRLLYLLYLLSLLSGQGLCQCYSESSCAGDIISSVDQRDCCVFQNGFFYNDTGTCRPCIGMEW